MQDLAVQFCPLGRYMPDTRICLFFTPHLPFFLGADGKMWFACNGKSSDAKMDCTRDESSLLPGVSESEALFLCKVRARGSSESGALKKETPSMGIVCVRARVCVCVHTLKSAPTSMSTRVPLPTGAQAAR